MKKIEITSLLESLLNFIIPKDKKSGGLYLRLSDTKNKFSHLIILKDGESFCIIVEQNSEDLYNQGGKMNPTKIVTSTTKNEFIQELIKLSFLEDKEYSLNVIREVQHILLNEFDLVKNQSVFTLARCFFNKKVMNIH